MTEYAIEFDDRALRQWDDLDGSVRAALVAAGSVLMGDTGLLGR
ncbi:hypothetical protein AAC691_20895 [Nguyenibacter vanlangensis]|uniref:Uncharacterized protein n=1 Tax=Nguyenibacter vanlangensis TaxID=1216886 RepID=A0ABZ3D5E8_9PROT